jgi:hypothetical protein
VRQLDNGGYCKILGNGTAEISGKGRFYVFKNDAQSALSKQTQYLWSPSVEISFEINFDTTLIVFTKIIMTMISMVAYWPIIR